MDTDSHTAQAQVHAMQQQQQQQQQQQPAQNMPSLFIPRSHRTNPIGASSSQFSKAKLAHSSTKQLIDSHTQLLHVLRTTAAHLPSTARQRLEQDALILHKEIEARNASAPTTDTSKGKGRADGAGDEESEVNGWILVRNQQQQAQAQLSNIDQLRGAIAHLQLDEAGPSQSAVVQEEDPLLQPKNMTLRQQLAHGLVTAGNAPLGSTPFALSNHSNSNSKPSNNSTINNIHSFQRRCSSGQGHILLLQPSSSALAEAEALQAADHLREMDEAERDRTQRLQAQQGRRTTRAPKSRAGGEGSAMDIEPDQNNHAGDQSSWSFHPEDLFGDDDDDDEDDQGGLASSMMTDSISQMSISQSTSSVMMNEDETTDPHRKVRRRIYDDGRLQEAEDNGDIPEISAAEQHALEAEQEARAVLDAEQPGRWAYEAIAAREKMMLRQKHPATAPVSLASFNHGGGGGVGAR
ncbi:hypothetical protein CF327_g2811 [Tilletia walkeri]|uniref:Uncharacterized protein n=1 Tax=Tilletia walkeri TaxID=117179 RepID=A0A8X7T411_9BASI|nr:hypothetical protein CF327_g2811 [Tilletia walkeri]KAE8268077.1 hypothetical protein A4X09_0g4257 [Tilletia walkeri]